MTRLALELFDQTRRLHGLGSEEREFLEVAGILHELGLFISHVQHHRHSYYLIRNSELLGFTENEKEIIANVARYHRKSHPKPKHPAFALLSRDDQHTVTALAAILRIADGLDRSHASLVKDLRVSSRGHDLVIHLRRRRGANLEMELWGAEEKKRLFEEVFKRKVSFAVMR